MEEEESNEIVYPSGEIDLKRQVTGEILRSYELRNDIPPVEKMVGIIERVYEEIKTTQHQKLKAGRHINVAEEVRKIFPDVVKKL